MIDYTTLGNLIAPAKVIRCGKGSFPVLSMTMHDGIVLQSERFKKSLASIDQSDYKVVKRGQLVVGFPIDEGVLHVQNAADEGIMSPAYNVWDIDTQKVDANFLELCLHSPQSMQYYKDKLRGTTARRRSIPTADLLALKIRLPDMQTQRETVAVMRKAEAVINARQKQLDFFDQLVKSRFIEMFGEPENNDKKWPIHLLGELCSIGSSKRVYQNEQSAEGVPFWRISDLVSKMDTGIANSELFIPEEKYSELKQTGLVPTAGDILVTSRGTLGRCYIIKKEDRFYFQDGMISWLSEYSSEVTPLYLKYLFMMSGFRKQIDSMQAGSTVSYLSIAMLKKLRVMVPKKDIQEQFAAFVEQTDKSKSAVQQSLNELETLKKALMQKYFG